MLANHSAIANLEHRFFTMQSKMTRIIGGLALSVLGLAGVCLHGVTGAVAQSVPVQGNVTKPAEPLVWDALQKESSPKSGDAFAEFVFSVTNISEGEVIIDHTQGSCSCTVA